MIHIGTYVCSKHTQKKHTNFRIAITSEKVGKGMEAEKADKEHQIHL